MDSREKATEQREQALERGGASLIDKNAPHREPRADVKIAPGIVGPHPLEGE